MSTARDTGACQVIGFGTAHYDLTTPEGLFAWIRNPGLDSYPKPDEQPPCPEPPRDELELEFDGFEFEIVDGIHIGTGDDVESANNVRVATVVREGTGDDADFVIPGSSLKGLLRSRVEYICRSAGAHACPTRSDEQTRCGKCRPCRLFGYTNAESAQRSALAIHDARISDAQRQHRQHVAIDRFTGGAAQHLLYTDELVTAGRFTIPVEVLRPIDSTDRNLLRAVIADLHDGLIGIGARTTSGQGTVRLTSKRRPTIANLAKQLQEGTP